MAYTILIIFLNNEQDKYLLKGLAWLNGRLKKNILNDLTKKIKLTFANWIIVPVFGKNHSFSGILIQRSTIDTC